MYIAVAVCILRLMYLYIEVDGCVYCGCCVYSEVDVFVY